MLADLAEDPDAHLDAFLEAHSYFCPWSVEDRSGDTEVKAQDADEYRSLWMRYLITWSVDRLLAVYARSSHTESGARYVHWIVWALVHKLAIEQCDEESILLIIGILREVNA